MYCGQCGKRVLDNMLFCPFCGAPIVIPDQDAPDIPLPKAAGEMTEPRSGVKLIKEQPVQEARNPVQEDRMPEERSGVECTRNEAATESIQRRSGEECTRDEAATESIQRRSGVGERTTEKPLASLFDDLDKPLPPKQVPKEEFEPLRFDFNAEEAAPEAEAETSHAVEDVPEQRNPSQHRSMPKRPENNRNRSANTYIPVKNMDMDDIFMDREDADEYDFDDAEEDAYEDDFDYEEPEYGSFFQRHIRGIVALILMLVLLAVCAIWAISPKGQMVLAQVNLAWSAEAYADLGYDAYQKDSDLMAAQYYEKAFNRDPENYEYAHSAMVAYYEADKLEEAVAMLKKCVDLTPDNSEPYEELLILYPDADTRPWDVSELIRMGYERTGAESLKLE